MSPTFRQLVRYYVDLGFYQDQINLGLSVQHRRMLWSASAYILLFLGLLAQQAIDLSKRPLSVASVWNWSVVMASAVVALALFAPFTHWFTRRRRKPSWEHVVWAFSFGFFINLSSNVIWKRFF